MYELAWVIILMALAFFVGHDLGSFRMKKKAYRVLKDALHEYDRVVWEGITEAYGPHVCDELKQKVMNNAG